MTLNELKYLVAIAKEKHFRKASEICFVSQPTLSIAIKKLEEELGVILLERSKTEVIVTPIGQQVVALAEKIIQQTNLITQITKEEQGDYNKELKIGSIYTIAPYLLPKLIPEFHKQYPKTPIILQEGYTDKLIEQLKSGELDLIIFSLPYADPNIETKILYEEPFVMALPKTHPLAKEKEISLDSITDETLLMLGSGHCFRDQVIELFPNLKYLNPTNYQLQKTLEGSSLETIRYMVASGVGITIIPCSSTNKHDEELYTIKPIKNPTPKRTVALAWRKSFTRKDLIDKFIQVFNQIEITCTQKVKN